MTLKKISVLIIIIAAAGVGIWYYLAYKTVPKLPVYSASLTDEQGLDISVSDYKGQYILISYFQTWCGDCVRELPSIEALQNSIGKDRLKVMIISDENQNKINLFKERFHSQLDYYHSSKPLSEQSIRVYPTTYLLNKDGNVIMSRLKRYDWNSEEVHQLIK